MAAKIIPIGRIVRANDRIDERHKQRTPPVVFRKVGAFGQNADDGDGGAEAQQQKSEHPRRGAGAERKSAHALQVARRPKGEQCDGHQGDSADEILRAANPFRHDRFDRRLARRSIHGYSSPKAGFEPVDWITEYACPGNCLASFLRQRQQNPKRFRAEWQMKSPTLQSGPATGPQIATFAIGARNTLDQILRSAPGPACLRG